MIREVSMLLVYYPLWFASGFYPKRLLPVVHSKFVWLYSNVLYWSFGLLHWWPEDPQKAVTGLMFNWVLAVIVLRPIWAPAVLIGWAALDAVWYVTGWHSGFWNWAIFGLALIRSLVDDRKPGEQNERK